MAERPKDAGRADVTLIPSAPRVRPGGLVEVDVYLDGGLPDLRGYQLHGAVGGGRHGRLELVDLAIHERKNAAFAGHSSWQAFNLATGQLLAGLDTPGVSTTPRAYLATFTYRASADAAGTFTVELLHEDTDPAQRTFLFPTPANGRIRISGATPAVIDVAAPAVHHGRAPAK
jgi:hypothetical protein